MCTHCLRELLFLCSLLNSNGWSQTSFSVSFPPSGALDSLSISLWLHFHQSVLSRDSLFNLFVPPPPSITHTFNYLIKTCPLSHVLYHFGSVISLWEHPFSIMSIFINLEKREIRGNWASHSFCLGCNCGIPQSSGYMCSIYEWMQQDSWIYVQI